MDRIGMLGIGVILVILGFILQTGLIAWLINAIGIILIVVGVVLVVLGVIKVFTGSSRSDY